MNIMQEMPSTILLLLDTDEVSKENLRNMAYFHGVHGHRRLIFLKHLGWEAHLYRLASCDLGAGYVCIRRTPPVVMLYGCGLMC